MKSEYEKIKTLQNKRINQILGIKKYSDNKLINDYLNYRHLRNVYKEFYSDKVFCFKIIKNELYVLQDKNIDKRIKFETFKGHLRFKLTHK